MVGRSWWLCVFLIKPGSFGASSLKLSNLNLGSSGTKVGTLQPLHGPKIRTPIRYDGLLLSQRSEKALFGCRCSPGTQCKWFPIYTGN